MHTQVPIVSEGGVLSTASKQPPFSSKVLVFKKPDQYLLTVFIRLLAKKFYGKDIFCRSLEPFA